MDARLRRKYNNAAILLRIAKKLIREWLSMHYYIMSWGWTGRPLHNYRLAWIDAMIAELERP